MSTRFSGFGGEAWRVTVTQGLVSDVMYQAKTEQHQSFKGRSYKLFSPVRKKSQSFHATIRLLFVLRGRMFVWTCDQVRHVLWKEADDTFTPQHTEYT